MYKHIIWDFDGTLFDTYPVMAKTFQEALMEQGLEEPMSDVLKRLKVSATFALQHYEKEHQINIDRLKAYQESKKADELKVSKPFEGIETICQHIQDTDRKNYLYTHRGESSIELLKMHGLYGYFTDCITSTHGFERKPNPAALRYLIEKYSMDPAEAIMIGDRELDLQSGKNAGIDACYFAEAHEKSEYADVTIHTFQELYSII
ncbi:HAD-IA family hydrolase [Aureibacillus halotolerans]|uniref:HAD superfamily hydrolase (TIGR01509 family)/HAD superfamily hydrolase (TIGR01549 family) n=1 Tax=Aureibacillus halotolerans TaxID=1508390 RepID=A0A4R6U0N8_9BACI|nr:HAD-IA family hydrolase [Aureibacillus halotolerans]TDQ36614.1 HAD superfamily hydrolase (TIGR01509 family)/HAD superfamily hydrolase (TIGR01549 family) [Aureibacillus halotolerans]